MQDIAELKLTAPKADVTKVTNIASNAQAITRAVNVMAVNMFYHSEMDKIMANASYIKKRLLQRLR